MKSKNMICKDCGSQGKPIKKVAGSFVIELILWLFFIVPGLIYSCWRVSNRYTMCPDCGSRKLIPVDSPKGAVLAKQHPYATPAAVVEGNEY